jgi:mismatch-specific thymine-DNA glycosylase
VVSLRESELQRYHSLPTIKSKPIDGRGRVIASNPQETEILPDIFPRKESIKILFIAKTPAPISVRAGHYFQGLQGKMFWGKLIEYGLLKVPKGEFEDTQLEKHGYGITDIVKEPREYGDEPSENEYREGIERVLQIIKKYDPKVIVFVYKKVLDKILKIYFRHPSKAKYGFNYDVEKYFGRKVFVFPMPGTPCTSAEANKAMTELRNNVMNA